MIWALLLLLLYFIQISFQLWRLLFACFCIFALLLLNYYHITHLSLYVLVGVVLWIAMLKSGVHATLAGVIISLFIPLDTKNKKTLFA